MIQKSIQSAVERAIHEATKRWAEGASREAQIPFAFNDCFMVIKEASTEAGSHDVDIIVGAAIQMPVRIINAMMNMRYIRSAMLETALREYGQSDLAGVTFAQPFVFIDGFGYVRKEAGQNIEIVTIEHPAIPIDFTIGF